MLVFFLILSLSPTAITHNRRTLHHPFFPLDNIPPSPLPIPSPPAPQIPFSAPSPDSEPFLSANPSPPSPPSPSSYTSFPANISSLSLPQPSKPKTTSSKLIAAAVASVLAAAIVISIVIFLHIRRRNLRPVTDQKTRRSDNSSQNSNRNVRTANGGGIPKLQRPSQTSSEFLYLGTLVSSHNCPNGPNLDDNGGGSNVNSRKLDSPELRPLPPLSQPSVRKNYVSADVGSAGDDEEQDFYSPRGSLGGRQSSMGTGSASRRAFAAENLEEGRMSGDGGSSSSLYSSSSSASPVNSISLSISPPVSLSPTSSRPKSPELISVQTAVPPAPPPPASITSSINVKESRTPSTFSSLSPERYLRKSQDWSPRLSNVSDQNSKSSARDASNAQVSSPRISVASDRNSQSPVRGLGKSADSSPRISNASYQNSPTRDSSKNQCSSPTNSNVSDYIWHFPGRDSGKNQDLPSYTKPESPEKISISVRQNGPVYASPPLQSFPTPPLSPSGGSIPAPPPPPPARHWESPRTPTPQARQQMPRPPVLVAPLRPLAVQNPSLVSPVVLPPTSETVEETPKPKLKPLHWDKVRASSDREMVWDQLRSSSFKLNEEMIETLFVVKTPNSNPKEQTRGPILLTLDQENRVLDPKKSQNIAILLRALNVTVDEVCEALQEGNADTLGTELLESLLKMAPTKEEERKLRQYKDDSPVKLGPAERFLKAILDIPFAFKRVDAMLYISNFDSEIEYLKKSFETLEAACEELRNSRMFLKLLEAVLKTGNRMNVGTNRGDAHAFKLDTLLKLVDVKGADGKTTLLHFVVQEIIRSEGARLSGANQYSSSTTNDDAKCRKLGLEVVSNLCSELANVKKAATMDSEVLDGEVMKLSRGIGKITELVRLNGAMGSDESHKKNSESMNKFMKMAEEEVIRVQAQESVALTLVKEITEYFHGNSVKEEAHPFRIFMVVKDFLTNLDRVCKDVGTINEQTVFSSAHKFPVPVNPTLPPGCNGFTGRRQYSSSDEESSSS